MGLRGTSGLLSEAPAQFGSLIHLTLRWSYKWSSQVVHPTGRRLRRWAAADEACVAIYIQLRTTTQMCLLHLVRPHQQAPLIPTSSTQAAYNEYCSTRRRPKELSCRSR